MFEISTVLKLEVESVFGTCRWYNVLLYCQFVLSGEQVIVLSDVVFLVYFGIFNKRVAGIWHR